MEESKPIAFKVGDVVLFEDKICEILAIVATLLGFNRYELKDVELGTQFGVAKHQIQQMDFLDMVNIEDFTEEILVNKEDSVPGSVKRCHVTLSEAEIDKEAQNRLSQKTKSQMRWVVKIFKDFHLECGEHPEFEHLPDEELTSSLRSLYCCVRTKDGQCYSRSGYQNLRSGIQCHLQSPPLNRKVDLHNDRTFQSANQCYDGVLKQLKKDGKDVTTHKNPINEMDLKKMYSSRVLGNENPVSLQRKVYFELALHFGRRGCEGWRSLMKDSSKVRVDSAGREYVKYTYMYNEYDKNHSNDEQKEQIMFAVKDDPLCPVKSFKKYMSLLHPKCSAFLQRPDAKYHNKQAWYVNAPLGVHTISTMLKAISDEAGTSISYTNHCAKATTGTVLKKASIANQNIMAVTGHKNIASLNSYVAGLDMDEMSSILGNYGKENEPSPIANKNRKLAIPSSTVTSGEEYPPDLTARTINVAEGCSSIFAGAHFSGQVTINAKIN